MKKPIMHIQHVTLAFTTALTLATGSLAETTLAGVDPRVYLHAREPTPTAVRDLRAADISVAMRILETGPKAFLVDDSAYPAAMKPEQRAALRVLEERALVGGALIVLAEKGSTERAVALIGRWLENRDPALRAEAAERLGQTRADVVATLVTMAGSDADAAVRAAACAGLGRHRSAAALEALAPFVVDHRDPVRQLGAVRALGILSSKWAWQGRGDVAEGERLRARSRVLLASIDQQKKALAVGQAIDDVSRQLAH